MGRKRRDRETTVPVTIKVQPSLLARCEKKAEQLGMTRSEVAAAALDLGLAGVKRPKGRKRVTCDCGHSWVTGAKTPRCSQCGDYVKA